MMIVTADDFGRTAPATDRILECWAARRITSASAMVFMQDSERAAALSLDSGLEVGLHVNFTERFTSGKTSPQLRRHHNRVVSYLNWTKFAQVVYNPLLRKSFAFVFAAQLNEFVRLYGDRPVYYNGHHHMHLCANVLIAGIIPKGARSRRTFTFTRGDKGSLNRLYRTLVDSFVGTRFTTTDCFFSAAPIRDEGRLRSIFEMSAGRIVEIEVHPEDERERNYLLSDRYGQLFGSFESGRYRDMRRR